MLISVLAYGKQRSEHLIRREARASGTSIHVSLDMLPERFDVAGEIEVIGKAIQVGFQIGTDRFAERTNRRHDAERKR